MTREERRRLLGDLVVADLHRQVLAAPTPTEDVIADLRRILTRPAGRCVESVEAPQRAA